ncbi:MAG: T9SS type A sorting domain-containing protein [Bacteroidia bacterium]
MFRLLATYILSFIVLENFAQEHFYDFISYGESSEPEAFYEFNGKVIFFVKSEGGQKSMYITDGSGLNTNLVYTFTSGTDYFRNFTEFNGHLFFQVFTSTGTEIWRTNGTPKGTKVFHKPPSFFQNRTISIVAFNDWLVYQDHITEDSFYVRAVDTSLTNSKVLHKIAFGHIYGKSPLFTTPNYLFYAISDKIYRIDKNFASPQIYYDHAATGGIYHFRTYKNVLLWFVRGSSKTQIYAGKESLGTDKYLDELNGYPGIIDTISNGNFFYYVAQDWQGIGGLYRINTNNLNYADLGYCHSTDKRVDLGVYKNTVYFSGYKSGDGEIYKVGNLSNTPLVVKNIAADTSSNPRNFYALGDKLFFSAFTKENGRELWQTEGNAGSTKLAIDFFEGAGSSLMGLQGIIYNNKLLVSAYHPSTGTEVWITDGTEAGTSILLDLNPKVDRGNQQVSTLMPVGEYLYLFANDSINGAELWRTDGSKDGTILLDNINIANLPSGMGEYTEFKGNLYGTAFSFVEGIELYKSNGTPNGSDFVTPSDLFSSSAPQDYVVDGNYIYYIGSTGLFGGQAIFRSDGTKAGTKVYLGDDNDIEDIANLTKVGGMMCVSIKRNGKYGAYYVDTKNEELKALDMVDDLGHSDFFCGNDSIILFLHLDATGVLYQTNITPPNVGTGGFRYDYKELNKTIMPDTFFMADSSIAYMVAFMSDNSKKVISYRHFDKVTQVNKGVGINPIINYSNVKAIAGFGTNAIFSAYNSTYGQELFITDGTDSGVVLLADINPGSASSNPENFYVFNGRLIFTATSAAHGTEVWITDGTSAGTKLLWDIQKGNGSSYPTEYAAYKGYLYIAASDSTREKSLYRFIIDSCDIIAPEITSNKNSFVVCEGETIDLYAKTGIDVEKLTWFKNGNPVITAGDTFTTNEIAKYKFEAANGSCAVTSLEIELKSAPAVNFSVGFESDSGFCEGGSLNLIASGDNDLKVKWYKDDSEYSSQLKTTTFAKGEFFAIGRNQFGCRDTSRILTVNVYESPNPNVQLRNDTLWSSETGDGYTYQWFFKGEEMPGETSQFVAPKENGAYKVEVTNDKGCIGESNGFKYEGSSINDLIDELNISVYPNPFKENTFIRYNLPTESHVQIEVYNELGQKIETLVDSKQHSGPRHIELFATRNGLYFIKVLVDSSFTTLTLMSN